MNSKDTSNLENDRGSYISPAKKKSSTRTLIIAEHMNGLSFRQIAERLNVSVSTVATVWKEFESTTRASTESVQQFRERITNKAYDAVNDGLDCTDDPYKRASLGVQVLKGVGEFENDTSKVQINNFVQAIPSEWRERYLGIGGKDEIELRADVSEAGERPVQNETTEERKEVNGKQV